MIIKPGKPQYFHGVISYEQDIKREIFKGDIGIQISDDGRIWICVDGQSVIRFKSKTGDKK